MSYRRCPGLPIQCLVAEYSLCNDWFITDKGGPLGGASEAGDAAEGVFSQSLMGAGFTQPGVGQFPPDAIATHLDGSSRVL